MKKFVTPQKQPADYYKMILPVVASRLIGKKQIKYLKLIVPNCIFCYIYGVNISYFCKSRYIQTGLGVYLY